MNQLKEKFAVVTQYGFWICTSLVLLSSAVLWYLSTSQLVTQHESRSTKIKNDILSVTNIRNEIDTHPNEDSHKEMQSMIDGRKDEVLESWRQLFESQRNILVWPQSFTADFLSQFENKIPVEKHFVYEPESLDPTETTLRVQYSDYIKNELPKIAKLAGTEWTAGFSAGTSFLDGGFGTNNRRRDEVSVGGLKDGPLVEWSTGSQDSLLADVFPWRGTTPSTLEICYSQENLWILRQLMEIIGQVNEGAKQPYQADIHEIKRLSIGQSVRFTVGNIATPGSSGFEAEFMDDLELDIDLDMGMATGIKEDPADLRYVDTAREPISGATLRSAITSHQPSDVNLAVAKRVPVMMSLKMNQKSIPELLATCGSVPLKVEVQQVRILEPDASGQDQGGGGGGGGAAMAMVTDGDLEMEDDLGDEMSMGAGGITAKPKDEFPLDVTVEVYGLIFIYNPPNLEALGVESITAETELTDGPEIVANDSKTDPQTVAAPQPAAPQPISPDPQDNPAADAEVNRDPDANLPIGGGQPDAAPPAGPVVPDPTVPDPTVPAGADSVDARPAARTDPNVALAN